MLRPCALLTLLTLLAFAPARAEAQSLSEADRRTAAACFDRGTLAYERGDYDEAEAEFRAAYALTRHPDLQYNVYTAAERAGRLVPAAEALEAYLREGGPDAARREALTLRAARLRARIAEEEAAAAAQRDATERERAEAAARLAEERGEREAAQESATAERDARLRHTRSAHETADALTILGVVGLAAGGAAGIVFGAFAGLSETADEDLAARCGRDAGRFCTPDDVAALAQWNLAADVSWIAAAGLGVTGAALLLVGAALRPGEPTASAWLAPALGPGLVGVQAGGDL